MSSKKKHPKKPKKNKQTHKKHKKKQPQQYEVTNTSHIQVHDRPQDNNLQSLPVPGSVE